MKNVRTKLIKNPKTDAGKELNLIVKQLPKVVDEITCMNWTQTLIDWHAKFKTFLNEKTYLETQNNNGIKIKWWYTHKRIKSAYKQLIKLVENDTIFTYVRMPQLNIPKTTNLMEGDINSQIRNLLKIHRGMPIKHRKILTERFLWSKREK